MGLFGQSKRDKQIKYIMGKLSELEGELATVKSNLEEGFAELTKRIADLEAGLGDVEIPAGAQTALNDVKTLAAKLANVISTPTPPPTP